jgi:transcription elongation factor Elf1
MQENDVGKNDIEMVEICRNERFLLPQNYTCPHCNYKNDVENINNSLRDYDEPTQTIWASCELCQKAFQMKGKAILRKAVIPVHSRCKCGRHFLFSLVRDVEMVRFSKHLRYPFIKCAHCKRQHIIITPENLFRYWLAVRIQHLQYLYKKQCRAVVRLFTPTV